MNEFLRNFVKKTIFKMIVNVPEWQVREYALGWYAKGILTEEDLAIIEQKYAEEEQTEEVEENAGITEEPEPREAPKIEEIEVE